ITPQDLADPEFLKREGLPADYTNTIPLESPIGLDNTIQDCVPVNLLGSANLSPEALDYIGTHKKGEGFVDQDFAEVLLTGELFTMPAGVVGFAAGLTWRDQQVVEQAFMGYGTGVGGKQ